MKAWKSLVMGMVCAVAQSAWAAELPLTASEAWARATVSGQPVGAVFMTLQSTKSVEVISAQSPAAKTTEVHEMVMEGNVMKMRAITRLNVPAGEAIMLKPGGHHIMLIHLKKALVAGEKVPVTLKFRTKSSKEIHSLTVEADIRAMPGMNHGHAGGQHPPMMQPAQAPQPPVIK